MCVVGCIMVVLVGCGGWGDSCCLGIVVVLWSWFCWLWCVFLDVGWCDVCIVSGLLWVIVWVMWWLVGSIIMVCWLFIVVLWVVWLCMWYVLFILVDSGSCCVGMWWMYCWMLWWWWVVVWWWCVWWRFCVWLLVFGVSVVVVFSVCVLCSLFWDWCLVWLGFCCDDVWDVCCDIVCMDIRLLVVDSWVVCLWRWNVLDGCVVVCVVVIGVMCWVGLVVVLWWWVIGVCCVWVVVWWVSCCRWWWLVVRLVIWFGWWSGCWVWWLCVCGWCWSIWLWCWGRWIG